MTTIELRDDNNMIYIDEPKKDNEYLFELNFIDPSCNGVLYHMGEDDFANFCNHVGESKTQKNWKWEIVKDEITFTIITINIGKKFHIGVQCGLGTEEDETFSADIDKTKWSHFLTQIDSISPYDKNDKMNWDEKKRKMSDDNACDELGLKRSCCRNTMKSWVQYN